MESKLSEALEVNMAMRRRYILTCSFYECGMYN